MEGRDICDCVSPSALLMHPCSIREAINATIGRRAGIRIERHPPSIETMPAAAATKLFACNAAPLIVPAIDPPRSCRRWDA